MSIIHEKIVKTIIGEWFALWLQTTTSFSELQHLFTVISYRTKLSVSKFYSHHLLPRETHQTYRTEVTTESKPSV